MLIDFRFLYGRLGIKENKENDGKVKPVKTENLGFTTYRCPCCNNKLYRFELFCDVCKKKINWE